MREEMDAHLLTVILPIRVTSESQGLIGKIRNILLDNEIPSSVEFIIVDDGSLEQYSIEIRKQCKNLSTKYLHIDSCSQPFSLARARNMGAIESTSTLIMFQDIDMMPYNGFYKELLFEVNVQGLQVNTRSFIMISAIYLTEKGTKAYSPDLRNYFIDKMILNDTSLVERYSSGTSLILLNKSNFLKIGMYDEKYTKWGHEDIDLNCRLILRDNLFEMPKNFTRDEKNFNNIYDYEGWKSVYRLYGDRTFMKGIVLFHAWHKRGLSNDYYSNKIANKKYFHSKIRNIYRNHRVIKGQVISTKSILYDRYKYSMSKNNRLSKIYSLKYIRKKIISFTQKLL